MRIDPERKMHQSGISGLDGQIAAMSVKPCMHYLTRSDILWYVA